MHKSLAIMGIVLEFEIYSAYHHHCRFVWLRLTFIFFPVWYAIFKTRYKELENKIQLVECMSVVNTDMKLIKRPWLDLLEADWPPYWKSQGDAVSVSEHPAIVVSHFLVNCQHYMPFVFLEFCSSWHALI